MKRKISRITAFIMIMMLVTIFTGCNGNQKDTAKTAVCTGIIKEMDDTSILVTPVEGSSELSSSDAFHISTEHLPASPVAHVGDKVEITYEGGILETYPAKFEKVVSIKIITNN